jgi:excisionase family DNA binding protein
MSAQLIQDFPQLLTSNQAADYLSISPATLRIWRSTKRHSIRYTKVGSLVRYRRRDLDTFLEQRTVGAE